MLADTAIVTENYFFHYCHRMKTFVALQLHHPSCPYCYQKNPLGIPNSHIIFLVTDFSGRPIMSFEDQYATIEFLQKNWQKGYMLRDIGYVSEKR